MKKYFKRVLSVALMICLITSLFTYTNADAATVKISKTNATLYVGDSTTLKVSGTSKTVKWTSSKKSVATVSSKGKVTAKKEGSATITAKVNGKSYKCKVTVLSKFSSKDALKNIQCDLKDTGKGVVAILTNKNSVAVSISAKLVYFNDKGSMLMAASDSNYCLEPNASCAMFFYAPYDSSYEKVDYSDYKITMSVEKSLYSNYASSKIDVVSNLGDNVTAEFTNNSKYDLDTVQVAVVYYDANKNAIGYEYSYANCESIGSVDYKTFDLPYDSEYNAIIPDSYEIFINHAYKFN